MVTAKQKRARARFGRAVRKCKGARKNGIRAFGKCMKKNM